MSGDMFYSSDSVRTAGPLKHVRYVTFDEPLALARGGRLEQVRVAYETYGRLSAAGDNAVFSDAFGRAGAPSPGCWFSW